MRENNWTDFLNAGKQVDGLNKAVESMTTHTAARMLEIWSRQRERSPVETLPLLSSPFRFLGKDPANPVDVDDNEMDMEEIA